MRQEVLCGYGYISDPKTFDFLCSMPSSGRRGVRSYTNVRQSHRTPCTHVRECECTPHKFVANRLYNFVARLAQVFDDFASMGNFPFLCKIIIDSCRTYMRYFKTIPTKCISQHNFNMITFFMCIMSQQYWCVSPCFKNMFLKCMFLLRFTLYLNNRSGHA